MGRVWGTAAGGELAGPQLISHRYSKSPVVFVEA